MKVGPTLKKVGKYYLGAGVLWTAFCVWKFPDTRKDPKAYLEEVFLWPLDIYQTYEAGDFKGIF